MGNLHESASLFEVNIPDYKQLKACRREVRYCKSLYFIHLVICCFSNWKNWQPDIVAMQVQNYIILLLH